MDRADAGDVQLDARTALDRDLVPGGATVSEPRVPGARPEGQGAPEGSQTVVVGDIPAQAPGFLARSALLAELDRAGLRVSVIQAAAGLRGVGATQLAAAYARAKVETGWRLVAWVSGADPGSLLAGLAAVADAIGLPGDVPGHGDTAAAAVRQWLEANGDQCLLVIDDVADPLLLAEALPARGPARVLITGTPASAGDLGPALWIEPFSAPEAVMFLAGRTGLDDEAGAAAVAAVLDNVPLPLALAAPVIGTLHNGYAGYLGRLQALPSVVLTADDEQPYPPGLVRAVLLSLQAVRAEDRTGICTRVLELVSVLSAGGVRRDLLYAAGRAGVLASGRQRVAVSPVDRVLEWLGGRSLLTFSLDGQTVMVHPLIAQVIRDGLEVRRGLTAVCEAAAFVLDVYSRALVGSADRWAARGIPQQVTALLDTLAGSVNEVDEDLAWLLLRLRFTAFYHLLELGDSTPQAIEVGERLTQDLERLLGAEHPDTLSSRNSLATAYLSASRVAEAIALFEQTLAVRQHILGPDDPDTLTSQNNLASAYQDAGRSDEAIRLYALNLETRERLLGGDHPSTLNSCGNLAAAYQEAGRAEEAIPLLERTLAGRERTLGPDHPDTRTSRKNLARAYTDVGRGTEATPLLERTADGRPAILRADRPAAQISPANLARPGQDGDRAAEATRPTRHAEPTRAAQLTGRPAHPAGFRRPPAEPARRALPASMRRPPLDAARPPLPSGLTRPPAGHTRPSGSLPRPPAGPGRPPASPVASRGRHSAGRAPEQPEEFQDQDPRDREIVTAMAAGDPAGLGMVYDRYAASLYGYCHWMLHDSAGAAAALTDTFAVAASRLDDLPEQAKLRAWLFALARNECRRRIRPGSPSRDEQPDPVGPPPEAGGGRPDSADNGISDSTVQFSAISGPAATPSRVSDSTVPFSAISSGAAAMPSRASDSTVQFPALGRLTEAGSVAPDPALSDSTMQFRAIGQPADAAREPFETMPLSVASLPMDATMPFLLVSQPASRAADAGSDRAEAELRSLLHSVLAGLTGREREVIELSFTDDLHDDELAVVFDVSWSRAHTMAERARGRLEEALSALHIVLTRRESCGELGELLADWDGQLTEQTRDVVSWHVKGCQTCAQHGWGALRPAAFGRLLPPAPLPPELRDQVLGRCTSPAADAVAYRRKAARRANARWRAGFLRAGRQLSWAGLRAHPGAAIAVAAVTLWVAAAVVVTLLTFAVRHVAYVPAAAASTAHSTGAPTARDTASASTRAHHRSAGSAAASDSAGTSPAVSHPAVVQPLASTPPSSPHGSASSSQAAKSPSATPSKSPSSSHSASSSPSPSHSASSPPTSTPSPSP